MNNLNQVFEMYKKHVYEELAKSKYKPDPKVIKLLISTYQKLVLFDMKLKSLPFFSTIP